MSDYIEETVGKSNEMVKQDEPKGKMELRNLQWDMKDRTKIEC